jgi:hypothetical protein
MLSHHTHTHTHTRNFSASKKAVSLTQSCCCCRRRLLSLFVDCRVSHALGLGSWGRGECASLPALRLQCRASLCFVVSEAARCAPHGTHGARTFPFQRVMRVLHRQHQQTSCVYFRFPPPPCSRMPYDTFWSDACRNAESRPLPTLLEALYAVCGATVRRPPLLPLGACPAHACVAGCVVCV